MTQGQVAGLPVYQCWWPLTWAGVLVLLARQLAPRPSLLDDVAPVPRQGYRAVRAPGRCFLIGGHYGVPRPIYERPSDALPDEHPSPSLPDFGAPAPGRRAREFGFDFHLRTTCTTADSVGPPLRGAREDAVFDG